MSKNILLKTENLTKCFGGVVALENVNVEVFEGDIVGLIGPNGAGKTTFFNVITGLLKPTAGKVIFKGKDITGLPPHEIVNMGIARTFQVLRPLRHLPAIYTVILGGLTPRVARLGEWVKRVEARAMDILEFLGLADIALEPVSNLSHGELRRLDIARAIATNPELLLLDEPFSGLSPTEAKLLISTIKRLHKGEKFGRFHSTGYTLVVVDHRLEELMGVANRIIVFHQGRKIFDGLPVDVSKNEVVLKAYMGE